MKYARVIPKAKIFFALAISLIFISVSITCNNHGRYKRPIINDNIKRSTPASEKCDEKKGYPQLVLIPTFTYSSQVVYDCNTYNSEDVAVAFAIFYDIWTNTFGDRDYRIRSMLDNVMVQWGKEKKILNNVYDVGGSPREVSYVVGMVITKSMIWVYTGDGRKISESSLVHELVHLSIRRVNNSDHGDPDHEGSTYSGWTRAHTFLIQETNRTLRAFGI